MADILDRILGNPVTGYILSFGGLGILLTLALNSINKFFSISHRALGLLTIACGAVGGMLIHLGGLVTLPVSKGAVGLSVAAFFGAATAFAAAGFSDLDLRSAFKKAPKDVNGG